MEDTKEGEPLNINIVRKVEADKENVARRVRPPPAVGEDLYKNIDEKDIDSKLSRLQDLLKMAKNS